MRPEPSGLNIGGGCSPLQYAAADGREATVKKLIEMGSNVNATDKMDWTALHRFPVPGSWFLVPGSWFIADGSWWLVHGRWLMLDGSGSYFPVYCLRCLIFGLWSRAAGLGFEDWRIESTHPTFTLNLIITKPPKL